MPISDADRSLPSDTPYADLTPNGVLDALDGVGLRGDGRLIQLNSYENRVFQVFLEDGRVVVAKFYRPGRWSEAQILEEHAFALELAAAEIPVVPPRVLQAGAGTGEAPVLHGTPPTLATAPASLGAYRFAVAERRAGRAPELEQAGTLEWIGRFLGRMHAVGAARPFTHRLRLDVDSLGKSARDWLVEHELGPPEVAGAWRSTADAVLDAARRAFDRAGDVATIRLHGDCHLGNVLWTEAGPHFVDLDDACTGPAMQDLWMLLSGDRAARARQLGAVLDGYEAFRDFDRCELGLVEALRSLRILHHSAWIARRWADPAFPAAFPWFGSSAYWGEQLTRLREQLEAMDEPPLVA